MREHPLLRQFPARIELYSIPSLTISDEQFLKGDANGKPVTVNGELPIAQGSGRIPVVVLVHGSGGPGPNIELWVRELISMGISRLLDAQRVRSPPTPSCTTSRSSKSSSTPGRARSP